MIVKSDHSWIKLLTVYYGNSIIRLDSVLSHKLMVKQVSTWTIFEHLVEIQHVFVSYLIVICFHDFFNRNIYFDDFWRYLIIVK